MKTCPSPCPTSKRVSMHLKRQLTLYTTIFIRKSGAGKLLFEPGLIRAVEDESLLDTDHEGQLIHEINILLFIGSLYMMLKIMWMVQNVSLRSSFQKFTKLSFQHHMAKKFGNIT